MLQNVLSLWSRLDLRRKIVIGGATLAMFLVILGLSRVAGTPNMSLLYAGLDPSAAGEIVAALDQRGVIHEVRGDSILVDAGERDGLRMMLAAEGLPKANGAGYELLDGLSGFGTTAQMFDAATWRAREGELARTILASPQIRAARVHIARTPDQAFRRDERPTASVTVTTATGNLPAAQARALRHLVSAAVSGMRPEDVQIIDSVSGLIGGEAGDPPGGRAEDRASAIRNNVERLLSARVGAEKAVVEVAVDLVTEREQITERRFDPAGRVAISSETQESSESSTQPGGDVTVASNLPDGDAGQGGDGRSQQSETRERINYEVSETSRAIDRAPGDIRRISVAVLVDGQMVTAADGTESWQPRSDEELGVLRDLVSAAVGLDEKRGDVLTVKSLQFQPSDVTGTSAEAGFFANAGPVDIMAIIQIAVLGIVAVILGLFVIRPILTSSRAALPPPPQRLALTAGDDAPRVLTGEIDDDPRAQPMISTNASDDPVEDPVTRLRRLIEQRQSESVEILRGWMELEEERS